jgi:iron(III) transport system substrate-binding protein
MARKKLLVSIGLVVGLWAANSPAAVSEQALQELYKAAKAEGEVIFQIGGSVKSNQPIFDAFQKRYPAIKIKAFTFGNTEIPTRIITEARSGKISMDVCYPPMHRGVPLVQRDLLVTYDWTKTSDAVPEDIQLNGTFLVLYDHPPVWIYNKNLVSEKEAPKTWEDLLDPKWKGYKISVRTASSHFGGLFPLWRREREKVLNYLRQLRKQDFVPGSRGPEATSRVATGECPIGIAMIQSLHEIWEKGAPIGVCKISPSGNTPIGVVIPKGAPHPNAAKLLTSWLATQEGKVAIKRTGVGPAYPPEASATAKVLHEAGIEFTRIVSVEDLLEYSTKFDSQVAEALGFRPE